jgi:CheY-like chemotaxis protein
MTETMKTILIVDDDEAACYGMRRPLHSYAVSEAGDAEAAQCSFRSRQSI